MGFEGNPSYCKDLACLQKNYLINLHHHCHHQPHNHFCYHNPYGQVLFALPHIICIMFDCTMIPIKESSKNNSDTLSQSCADFHAISLKINV